MGWQASNGSQLSGKVSLRKANAILENQDVNLALRELFGAAEKFYPGEAATWLVRHIRGEVEVERTVVTKDGVEKVKDKLPPSLDALKHYNALAFPKPVKQVQIDSRMIVAKAMVTDEPPEIRARALEKPVKELKGDSPAD